ncbi:hypothetical protein [Nocardioides sp.]|uniref:hypothetical protein n=1 Tax=Nocardioides sp. TaxID=35761 RepID=UPI002732CE4A|nr:hypothetical protein [Nocardioides sp.]MDP3893751.1 hypothetical protein [Nocardioides sp.]
MRERLCSRLVVAGLLLVSPLLLAAGTDEEGRAVEVFRFADPEIVESSGLVVTDEHVVTVNDSGDSGRIFTVDLATGETVGVTRWTPDPVDVEALAPAGAGHVWVADIGDNTRRREEIELLRVPFGPGDRTAEPERYRLAYPGPAADAETLLAHPETGRLFVVTKNVFGGTVYAAPSLLEAEGLNRLREVGTVVGIATDGAFFPDGRHLIVRTYARAVVYTFPELEAVDSFATPRQEQGEGIAVAPDGRVYVSSEGVRSPFLRLRLPETARRALDGSPQDESPQEGAPQDGASAGASPPPTVEPEEPEGFVDAEGEPFRRDPWPWVAGGLVGVVAVVVLLRSLRPH